MPDSSFIEALNVANDAFAELAGEKFEVVKTGNIGEYDAVSIDDLTTATSVTAGGLRGDNTVAVWVARSVLEQSGIVEGTVLRVRTKRVRVNSISDEGDNTPMLQCGSSGIKL